MRLFALCSLFISGMVMADWQLQQPSAIHFVTTKNTNVSEIHSFNDFDGKVTEKGEASLNINLASVDTRISIRDERMQKHLFELPQFSDARFEAQIPQDVLKAATQGQAQMFDLQGTLVLHGERAQLQAKVLISANKDNSVTVTSVTPFLVDAETFTLASGVQKLREIAGLKSISNIVPVTFTLTFAEK